MGYSFILKNIDSIPEPVTVFLGYIYGVSLQHSFEKHIQQKATRRRFNSRRLHQIQKGPFGPFLICCLRREFTCVRYERVLSDGEQVIENAKHFPCERPVHGSTGQLFARAGKAQSAKRVQFPRRELILYIPSLNISK